MQINCNINSSKRNVHPIGYLFKRNAKGLIKIKGGIIRNIISSILLRSQTFVFDRISRNSAKFYSIKGRRSYRDRRLDYSFFL